jgi:hypothetical protein
MHFSFLDPQERHKFQEISALEKEHQVLFFILLGSVADPETNPDPDHRIHMVLGLLDPDPDPLVIGMDPDPDHSINKQK